MDDLKKRLKDLQGDLERFQAETQPTWEQVGRIFNELLQAAKNQRPDDPVVQAIGPVSEQQPIIGQISAPVVQANAGSMLVAVRQLLQSVGGGRPSAA